MARGIELGPYGINLDQVTHWQSQTTGEDPTGIIMWVGTFRIFIPDLDGSLLKRLRDVFGLGDGIVDQEAKSWRASSRAPDHT